MLQLMSADVTREQKLQYAMSWYNDVTFDIMFCHLIGQ